MAEDGHRSSRELVLSELRRAPKFVVISHEHPDGDALGSLIAMQEMLTGLGRDSVMFIDRSRLRMRADSACCETPSTAAAAAIDPCLPTSRSARSAPRSRTVSLTGAPSLYPGHSLGR